MQTEIQGGETMRNAAAATVLLKDESPKEITGSGRHLLARPISQSISTTTITTNTMAVQNPALYIPATNSQEESIVAIDSNRSHNIGCCFMRSPFLHFMQKLCRRAIYFFNFHKKLR